MRRLLDLQPHERAVCFIGIGTGEAKKTPRVRPHPGQFFKTLSDHAAPGAGLPDQSPGLAVIDPSATALPAPPESALPLS
jgi:hypothetical protein